MNKADILSNLVLGNGVAEQDENLFKYYITTNNTKDFVNDRYDIVRGSKGAGKSAMLIAVQRNQKLFPSLDGVKLIRVSSIRGNPEFEDAFKRQSIGDIIKIALSHKIVARPHRKRQRISPRSV